MRGHLRIKSPWSQLSLFLLIFGLAWIAGQLVGLAIFGANGIQINSLPTANWDDPHVVATFKIAQTVSSLICFLLPALLFALFTFTGNYAYFLGFKPADKSNMYLLAVLAILLALPFVFWLGKINEAIPLPARLVKLEEEIARQMTGFLKVKNTTDIIINVIVIALLPAIAEELCFRGVLQRILINVTRKPWVGIVLTGILFSALHFEFMGFLPRLFLGIVLGACYWFSGSIWTSILAHFANNAVQVIAASYAPKYIDKNPESPLLAAIASGIVVWAILWFYQKQSTITYSKVYETEDLTPTNQFLA